jgi:hypothetical protein
MMTQKHYEELAILCGDLYAICLLPFDEMATVKCLIAVNEKFMDFCLEDNPAFDRDKFTDAIKEHMESIRIKVEEGIDDSKKTTDEEIADISKVLDLISKKYGSDFASLN